MTEEFVTRPGPKPGDVYEWMGCRQMVLTVYKRPTEQTVGDGDRSYPVMGTFAKTMVVQLGTGEFWEKEQPFPFPAEAAQLIPEPFESLRVAAEKFREGMKKWAAALDDSVAREFQSIARELKPPEGGWVDAPPIPEEKP